MVPMGPETYVLTALTASAPVRSFSTQTDRSWRRAPDHIGRAACAEMGHGDAGDARRWSR